MATGTFQDAVSFLQDYSNDVISEGNTFVRSLKELQSVQFDTGSLPSLGFSITTFDEELGEIKAAKPARPDMSLSAIQALINQIDAVAVPAAPDLAGTQLVIPELDASAPAISLPVAPSSDVGDAPTNAPEVADVAMPDAPIVALPVAPTFEELALPAPPSLSLGTFAAEAPENQLGPITARFEWVEPEYESQLRDPLVRKLLTDLVEGGYGIEEADEQRLWGRERDRQAQVAQAEIDEIRREAAGSGMPMPTGAMFAALDRARQKMSTALAGASRDIALKRADMYVENRRFTIEQVQRLEEQTIQLFNSIAERSLNYAKSVAEIGIAIYDAQVRSFQADLDAYKTEAQVFESNIRAELAKADVYKTQIEAAGLALGMQRTKAELYRTQLDGINTVVQVYRSRIEAANIAADLQKTKLEGFRARVQAYAESVRAQEARFHMYDAGVKGELAKLEVYKTQIDAYNKRIDSLDLQSKIVTRENDTKVQRYAAQLRAYDTQVGAVVNQLEAKLKHVRTNADVYGTDIAAYRALVDALNTAARVRNENQERVNSWNKAVAENAIERSRLQVEAMRATVENSRDIGKWGSEFYAKAFAAAVSGINGITVTTNEG